MKLLYNQFFGKEKGYFRITVNHECYRKSSEHQKVERCSLSLGNCRKDRVGSDF